MLFFLIFYSFITVVTANAPECPKGDVRCKNGIHCVNPRYQCDGLKHCPDNSDEDVNMCGGKS